VAAAAAVQQGCLLLPLLLLLRLLHGCLLADAWIHLLLLRLLLVVVGFLSQGHGCGRRDTTPNHPPRCITSRL
jgi:hypothetical protein